MENWAENISKKCVYKQKQPENGGTKVRIAAAFDTQLLLVSRPSLTGKALEDDLSSTLSLQPVREWNASRWQHHGDRRNRLQQIPAVKQNDTQEHHQPNLSFTTSVAIEMDQPTYWNLRCDLHNCETKGRIFPRSKRLGSSSLSIVTLAAAQASLVQLTTMLKVQEN